MPAKRKLRVDKNRKSCANRANKDLIDIWNSDTDSSDIVFPVRKRCKRLIIEDDTDDEEHINDTYHQQSEGWVWKEKNNKPKIWNYTETPGIKLATLYQLGANKTELDIFNTIFGNMFWGNIVTETNRYAQQIRNNKNKR